MLRCKFSQLDSVHVRKVHFFARRFSPQGQTFVKLVDVDRDFYNATVSHAAILSALQGVVAQDPDADVEQLYFNAIVNIMFDIIKDRSTTSVYQTFAVHVPYNGLFTLARTGQGLSFLTYEFALD